MLLEVLSNRDLFTLEVESHTHGSVLEIDSVHSVRSTVSPVSDNDLLIELCRDFFSELSVIFGVLLVVVNSVEARSCAHKLKDTIHAEHCSELALDSSSLKTGPDLESSLVDDDGVFDVKEAGSFTDLLEGSFTESLFDDNVEQLVHHGLTVINLTSGGHADQYHALGVDDNLLLLTLVFGLENDCVCELTESVNTLSRAYEGTESSLHGSSLSLDDGLNTMGIPESHGFYGQNILVHL
jgi:hypothetical protein